MLKSYKSIEKSEIKVTHKKCGNHELQHERDNICRRDTYLMLQTYISRHANSHSDKIYPSVITPAHLGNKP